MVKKLANFPHLVASCVSRTPLGDESAGQALECVLGSCSLNISGDVVYTSISGAVDPWEWKQK